VLGLVLAAGLGTRLRPYSDVVSKAALPIAGAPIALRVIEQFRTAGVDRIAVIARSPEHDVVPLVEAHAREHGYAVSFGYQAEQRGSGHALMQFPGRETLNEHVLIGACDNICEPDELAGLVAQHVARGAAGTMAVLRVAPEKMTVSSNVVVEGERVTRIIEKPTRDEIDSPFAGPCLYAFSPKLFGYLDAVTESPRGELELQDAMQAFIDDGAQVEWFELSGRATLTTPDDLLALNERFFAQTSPPAPAPHQDVTFVPPCIIDDEVAIAPGCTIGPNAHLMRGCRVGARCTVRHAIVFPGAVVPDGTTVEHALVS
jgi:dTDP-glucose pyrophosphorylase